jgi:uncharacterized protein YjbI with pentapeptide repeats
MRTFIRPLWFLALALGIFAQTPGANVNMVSGTTWPDGDPYLQRQNEPSMAVSTRNPQHLLAAANDYRTVDIPFVNHADETGDSWIGIFKSFDAGQTWRSNLLPGYPQDVSTTGLQSPLKALQAASDPVVRAGTNGLFYVGAIAFLRGTSTGPDIEPTGVIQVSTYIDNNNNEGGDSIQFIHSVIIARGDDQHFLDKPWIATDIPRTGAGNCSFPGQSFPAGNVYAAFASFDPQNTSRIMFSKSTDCGAHWSIPVAISPGGFGDQGVSMTVDPTTGTIYAAWRRILNGNQPDAIFFTKSTNFGASFSAPVQIASFLPFDQEPTAVSFRTTSYPSIAADAAGRVYVAWAARGYGPATDSRIVISSSKNGTTWTAPTPVDPSPLRGHQVMPSLTFGGGKLMAVFYDTRDDHTVAVQTPENLVPIGTLFPPLDDSSVVFTDVIVDATPSNATGVLTRRHTIDVRVAAALPADTPQFLPSVKVSQYDMGSPSGTATNNFAPKTVEQLRFNTPNLPMFVAGTSAFIGDYIDIATSPQFVPTTVGNRTVWRFNTANSNSSVFHATWADNRDVRPPPDGNWQSYTPAKPVGLSLVDPAQVTPACLEDARTGMRNQNIYTSRIGQGLIVGSPGNSKPLRNANGDQIQRSFVVFAQNTTTVARTFQMSIPSSSQPVGGQASFLQSGLVSQLIVPVPARSTASRTVFVVSSDAHAQVTVNITEVNPPGGLAPLQGSILLNPDLTNPDLTNPDLTNHELTNPDLTNPDLTNPDLTNPNIPSPDLTNPDLTNPDLTNPDLTNPDLTNLGIPNPDLTNPDLTNPDLTNPDLTNQSLVAGSLTDATWKLTNKGNTSAAYSVQFLLKNQVPSGITLQVLVYKVYKTPAVKNCQPVETLQNLLIANVTNPNVTGQHKNLGNPDLTNPDLTNPDLTNPSIALAPGEVVNITLRIFNPDRTKPLGFDPVNDVTAVAVAHAANTGTTQPPAVASHLVIYTAGLPDGVQNQPYTGGLTAIGNNLTGGLTWMVTSGSLPSGLFLNPATGQITGSTTALGLFNFGVTVSDSAAPAHTDSQNLSLRIMSALAIATPAGPLAGGTTGTAYNAALTATGGSGTSSWSLAAGALPNGLTLSPVGSISGTPTAPGSFNFSVRATDTSNPPQTATQAQSISISAAANFPGWAQLNPGGTPPDARADAGAVYDPNSNRLLLFAGTDTGCSFSPSLNDVWALANANGTGAPPQWTQLSTLGTPPPVRRGQSVVYNPGSNRMVVFGGDPIGCGASKYNDTWVLTNANGVSLSGSPTWVALNPTGTPPPARSDQATVYDVAHNRMIIFGGFGPAGNLSDVWVLSNADGTGGTPQWTQLITTGTTPSATGLMAAAYDPASNRLIVFGGWNCCSAPPQYNELSVLTNANGLGGAAQWTRRTITGTYPSQRYGVEAVYDAGTKQMTIFGGTTATGQVNELWVLSNADAITGNPSWTKLNPAGTAPQGRGGFVADPAIAFDPASGRLIMFGGATSSGLVNDTWVVKAH